jgi:hypothetical protein
MQEEQQIRRFENRNLSKDFVSIQSSAEERERWSEATQEVPINQSRTFITQSNAEESKIWSETSQDVQEREFLLAVHLDLVRVDASKTRRELEETRSRLDLHQRADARWS